MHLFRHCTALLLVIAAAAGARAQTPAPQPATPQPGDATYAIFLGGREIGREQVSLARSGAEWVITSTGRSSAPIDLTINRFDIRYTADWQPIELKIDARMGTRTLGLATSFAVTTAINEITQNGVTNSKTDQISARTVVLPNNFFAAYEALAARLDGAQVGAEIPAYIAPQAEVKITVNSITPGQIAGPSGVTATRRYSIAIQNPSGPLAADVTIDGRARFARLDIPSASLTVVRQDLAGVGTRPETLRNPTDSDVTIPASGFSLAGTLTLPPGTTRLRHPAIVLIAGSGPVDRDETVAGIPIFAQLAGALAERGFIVLRYDKRGVGQSGGRTETVTIQDYADDLITAVKWLAKRKDVDNRRITAAGHSEGGAVAMLAAQREGKIGYLVLMGTPGTTGAELILEQQRHVLDVLKTPDAERNDKVALQTRIQNAVLTGKGWEDVPPELRKAAETPWFRSLLAFDPAKVMSKVKQPVLVIQGSLDTQVKPHHADRLGELARARKKAPAVDVVHLQGVNHLFVRAKTGEVSEYASLPEKTITPELATRIADWLNATVR